MSGLATAADVRGVELPGMEDTGVTIQPEAFRATMNGRSPKAVHQAAIEASLAPKSPAMVKSFQRRVVAEATRLQSRPWTTKAGLLASTALPRIIESRLKAVFLISALETRGTVVFPNLFTAARG